MADAIIGGLILSTLLSLFVVPSFYVLGDRYFGAKEKPQPEATIAPPHH